MFHVPRHFAHTPLKLSDTAEVRYEIDDDHEPNKSGGMIRNDQTSAIGWPAEDPILSEKNPNWQAFETAAERDLAFQV